MKTVILNFAGHPYKDGQKRVVLMLVVEKEAKQAEKPGKPTK